MAGWGCERALSAAAVADGCALHRLFEQQEARWIERNVPGLGLKAESFPKFFGNVGLQVSLLAGLRRGVQAQIQSHFMGRFAGAYEPAGEGVFSG